MRRRRARKALSAIYRTGQRFGVVHLIDVLRGKAGERIAKWDHDKLAVFGIGADLDETTWRGCVPATGGARARARRPRVVRRADADAREPSGAEGRAGRRDAALSSPPAHDRGESVPDQGPICRLQTPGCWSA
jgi:ATP-dependent DNA helicase RecQ